MWLILFISICSSTYLFYKRNKRLQAITIAALSLLVIYIFGFIFNLGNLGRLISYFAISLHILIALAAVEFEKNLFDSKLSKSLFSTIIVILLIFNAQYHIRFLAHQITIKGNNYNKLLFLKDFVHRYDIVLADENNTIFIPSISGKVFTLFLNTNVSQNEFELAELKRNQFFKGPFNEKLLIELQQKYSIDYVLLEKQTIENFREFSNGLYLISELVYEDELFVLTRLSN